jgi:hypothetical protein
MLDSRIAIIYKGSSNIVVTGNSRDKDLPKIAFRRWYKNKSCYRRFGRKGSKRLQANSHETKS